MTTVGVPPVRGRHQDGINNMNDTIAGTNICRGDLGAVKEDSMTAITHVDLNITASHSLDRTISKVVGIDFARNHMVQENGGESVRVDIGQTLQAQFVKEISKCLSSFTRSHESDSGPSVQSIA